MGKYIVYWEEFYLGNWKISVWNYKLRIYHQKLDPIYDTG
jgi:hypothetical protein